jgi:hypothetical protein
MSLLIYKQQSLPPGRFPCCANQRRHKSSSFASGRPPTFEIGTRNNSYIRTSNKLARRSAHGSELITLVSDGSAKSALLSTTTRRALGSRVRRLRGPNAEEADICETKERAREFSTASVAAYAGVRGRHHTRASRTSRTRSTRGRRVWMARSAAAMWRPYHAPERPHTTAPRRRDTASAAAAAADAIAADDEAGAKERKARGWPGNGSEGMAHSKIFEWARVPWAGSAHVLVLGSVSLDYGI